MADYELAQVYWTELILLIMSLSQLCPVYEIYSLFIITLDIFHDRY